MKLSKKLDNEELPVATIVEKLNEPQPLPMGRAEFVEWSDRIIAGAVIKGCATQSEEHFKNSQRFVLANMLLHLGPTESHKPDAYFIHSLRKVIINQVAHEIATELRDEAKARLAKEQQEDVRDV
jgi:hypothetical protein